VRWSGEDGLVLRWLYPESRFLVIVRHPVSAYHSMRNFGFDPPRLAHRVKWPETWVASVDDYARYWNALALSWDAVRDRLGVSVIRYEDVVDGRTDLDTVAALFGLKTKAAIAEAAQAGGALFKREVTAVERDRINELTAPARALFAYQE